MSRPAHAVARDQAEGDGDVAGRIWIEGAHLGVRPAVVIVYAAHANGTHHKLALDALSLVAGADAARWQNLFLKHATTYLEGSKAPDNTFKDFKNHVLHVRDDYWGGAPEKAAEWYDRLLAALRGSAWSDAAYAAGVLSHYYTDPIQPFHTAQTEAENAIHRACEWSISRSYDTLAAIGREQFADVDVAVPDGAGWLREMVCRGAETSNPQYEKLIAHYDVHRGTADPPAGLDATGRALVAELIAYASKGFAHILERAFAESGVTPPEVSLTAEAFLATLQIPQKWVEKKLTNAADRAQVLAMYHELQATWRVEATLPADDRAVRDLYAKEVAEPRAAKQSAPRAKRLAQAGARRRGAGSKVAAGKEARPSSRGSRARLIDVAGPRIPASCFSETLRRRRGGAVDRTPFGAMAGRSRHLHGRRSPRRRSSRRGDRPQLSRDRRGDPATLAAAGAPRHGRTGIARHPCATADARGLR